MQVEATLKMTSFFGQSTFSSANGKEIKQFYKKKLGSYYMAIYQSKAYSCAYVNNGTSGKSTMKQV
jgi:cyclopropane fatty-acyl-phospholipid synthase-like methyltransferase